MPDPTAAIIICTRNRPADLERTLDSIAATTQSTTLLIVIVDASETDVARSVRDVTRRMRQLNIQYHFFRGTPSGTRQRNYGIDHLPPAVNVVHFIDDDVVVLPGYFRRITQTFDQHPDAGGIGGFIIEADRPPRTHPHWMQRLFLLSSDTSGRVLPSGHTSPISPDLGLHTVEWLSSCASSYRRSVFDTHRFDPEVEGRSPRLEDLDFSYRVGRTWKLLAEPRAQLIHRTSRANRRNVADFAAEAVPRRYWFVEKNIRHPLRKPAFWWAMLGRMLALLASPNPEKEEVLRGHLRGLRDVWRRRHPLSRTSS